MKSLPDLAISRPVFAWMLMLALIIFGSLSFKRLGISQLPDVDFPVVGVSLNLPGAAPEIVESQVLDPIEDSIMQIPGISAVTSTAQQSSGNISVEFELGTNIDVAVQDINNRINQIRNLLPLTLFPPVLRKANPEANPILWLGLVADEKTSPADLMIYAKENLKNKFSTIPGVGNIVLGGYLDPTLRVWLDNKKLNQLDLAPDDVISAVRNEQLEFPAGQIEDKQSLFNIRVLGEAGTPADFGRIRIATRSSQGPNYRPTYLNEVAEVEEGIADVRRISRVDGKPGIGLGIVKQIGSNSVEVAQAVRDRVAEIRPLLPKNFKIFIRSDNTRFIKKSVRQLLLALSLSALLTSFVCFLFLGSWSSTMNVLMAIPTSVIGTFVAFYFFGFTLNTFTLLGLTLAIGIIVDDAIIILENIVRHRELGFKRREAALKGANEISFAAIASTVAVAAIFVPVVFMKGIIGRYFLQFGVTVTVAVVFSLLEALTLTPMRCSRFLQVEHQKNRFAAFTDRLFSKLALKYGRVLSVLLRHRWKMILLSIIFFLGSLLVSRTLPVEMMPVQDQSMFLMRFKLPVGTSLPVTDAKIHEVENYLLGLPEVAGVFSVVGGFGGDAVNQGMAFANLVDPNRRKLSQADLIKKVRKDIRDRIPGMEAVVQDTSLRGFSASRGFPIEFTIQGPDWARLTEITAEIMEKLKATGQVVDLNTDVQKGMPELRISPSREKLAAHAVAMGTVTNTINTLVGGRLLFGGAQYPKGGHRYPVEVRLKRTERDNISDLNKVWVRNNRGERVRLSDLVDVQAKPSLMLISRLNRARAITVHGNPAPGMSQQVVLTLAERVARSVLPPGYRLQMTGSSKSFRESFQSLVFAMLLGLLVSYMVLGSQFNSFLHPITVLMALPFSFSGAFIGLALGRQSINMFSMIGFILLMGIVKKNSILLVDYTNQCREKEGLPVHEALLMACPIRLRPILMTSVATIAAALPEAIPYGVGSETMVPMATAVIGGVVASTVLTLFVVPCVYSLLSRLERT